MRLARLFPLLIGSSMLFSSLAQAGEELVYVLWSLNSRAEMYLVQKLPDGKHKTLVSIQHDMSMDDGYLDHSGNIAYKRTLKDVAKGNYPAQVNAAAVATKMTREVLGLQGAALDKEGISARQAKFSLIYAVAGLDAAQGEYPSVFNADDVRKIQHQAEAAILAELQTREIQLQHQKTVRDTVLVDEVMELLGAKDDVVIFKTTYDLVCYFADGQLHTDDMSMLKEGDARKHPSGSVYSLGLAGSDLLFSDYNEDAYSCDMREESCSAEITVYDAKEALSRYQKTQHGITLRGKQMHDRYADRKRKNELGSRLLYMMLSRDYTEPKFTAWFIDYIKETTLPTLEAIEKQVVKKAGENVIPNVLFMGDYTEIINFELVKAFITAKMETLGVRMNVISRQETSDWVSRAGVSRLWKLVTAESIVPR